jgi:hypothetical protein
LPNSNGGTGAGKNGPVRQPLTHLVGVALLLGAIVVGGVGTADAASPSPAITDYIATPNAVPYTGGTVTVSASVAGASSCTFSTISPDVSGLPVTVDCAGGTASTIVVIATNSTELVKHVDVKLTAIGGGSQATGVTIITEAQAPPKPNIADLVGSPDPVPYTGGSVTVSATVNNASECTFSSTSHAISGLPTTVACTAGTATAVFSLPANTTTRTVRFPFELTAAGAVKSATAQGSVTLAPAPPPTISDYLSSPSPVSWTGGPVTLSAAVANATTCTFTATGKAKKAVSGLPATVPCSSGSASVNLAVGANRRRRPGTYTVKLTATGSGTNVTTTTTITVSPVTTPPTIADFAANPSPVPATGGAATLTATVANAVSCTFTSKKSEVSGLPVTVPCSVGSVSTTVSVPASTSHRTHSYLVKLTVHGLRKKTSATTLVTVTGQARS